MQIKTFHNITALLLLITICILMPVNINTRAETSIYTNKPLIIIDPGHGGKDCGAQGLSGLKEKDFNLSLAFALKRKLKKDFKIVFTREADYFAGINSRADKANSNKDGIFISLHTGSVFTQNKTGNFLIGYYSSQPEKNNFPEIDTINRKHTQNSKKLAKSIYQVLSEKNTVSIFSAPFRMLGSVNMPAIIIEADNMNSPEGSIRLKHPDYIEKTAKSISMGIFKYFKMDQQQIF